MGAVHGLTNMIALLEQTTITATGIQTGVDCLDVQGEAIVVIGGSACGSNATQTWKLQHSAVLESGYVNIPDVATKGTFSAAGNAAWKEAITVNFDGLERYVTLYITETGTSSSVVSCYILHRKNLI